MKSKAKGKILAILISLAMVFTMMPMMGGAAFAWSFVDIGYLKYCLWDDGRAVVTGYTDELPADVTVPAEITSDGVVYPVIGIDGKAFENCTNLTSIAIPKSVDSIGDGAFSNSGLTSITFESESVLKSIGGSVFENCKNLTSIAIPKSVKSIGSSAFRNCVLRSIVIPSGMTYIGNYVFVGCSNLNTIYYVGTENQWNNMPDRENDWANGCYAQLVFVDGAADVPTGKTLVYNGAEQTGVDAGEGYILDGTVKATNAGIYTVTATKETGYDVWADGSTEPKTITWTIGKATAKVTASVGEELTYNGKEQTGVDEGTGYILTGETKATDAGTYTAEATLVTDDPNYIYEWADESTEPKTITWTIGKAVNPLAIKAKTAKVKGSTKGKKGKLKKTKTLGVTKVIAFTKKGQGKMTYTKASGTKKIKINKTTGKVTVKKGLKKGTYKVKVKVKAAGNANYKASAWKTVTFKIKVK